MGAAPQYRAFTALFYPESAPADYARMLRELHVPNAWVLHQEEPEECKPHVHVNLHFAGKKTLAAVKEMMQPFGCQRVEPAHHLGAMTRYLQHLDNPEKKQYGREDVHVNSGYPYEELLAPVADPGPEIRAWIWEQGVTNYNVVMRYCDQERPDWAKWAENHPAHLTKLLDAYRAERGGL